jgi:ankyrin repeat protein
MKNKSTYMLLTLLVISAVINGSDCDSPKEHSIVPHLNTSAIERSMMGGFNDLASEQARIPLESLHAAVKDDDLKAVTELIESGVDVNSRGPLMMTPLTMGTYVGCRLPIIHALMRAGADVNQGSFMGGTPLSNAIQTGKVEFVRVFLAAGANPNSRSLNVSVLALAIESGQLQIARMLIAAGASVNTQLLRKAIVHQNLNMVRLLVDAGANVNDRDEKYSVLFQAKCNKNAEIIDFLSSKGAVTFWGEDQGCSIQ